jgi:hypothetical protein
MWRVRRQAQRWGCSDWLALLARRSLSVSACEHDGQPRTGCCAAASPKSGRFGAAVAEGGAAAAGTSTARLAACHPPVHARLQPLRALLAKLGPPLGAVAQPCCCASSPA